MQRPTAKITRPALASVIERTRLFRRLDESLRRHRVVWVNAHAGSGKTTLAASWLAARRRSSVWYQIDASDADPATFFYYLREAVGRLSRRRNETLPLLTPEYALGLAAYAQRFFERAGARLPSRTVLVLDDYQDLAEDAPLQSLLPAALASLPDDVRVVVLSRSAPPVPFARAIATGAVGLLDPDELDLTRDETRTLVRARVGRRAADADAETLWTQTRGWAAGTVLLLEAPSRTLPPRRGSDTAAQQVLFDYFAAEIFDRAPVGVQQLLLATALLPDVSLAAARELTGEPRAAVILEDLVRRNYFTVRLSGHEPRYRYHPLFREFLLACGRRTLDAPARRVLASRAAELASVDDPDEAAAILADAGDLDALARLVLSEAPRLARQGRLASLERWIRALPKATVEGDPWLSYWLGTCCVTDPARARGSFEAAYRLFRARADLTGALLAWSGIVSTYLYVWNEFASLDPWIAEMERLVPETSEFPSIEIDAQITSRMYAALFWRGTSRPHFDRWERRALDLLDSDVAPELRMQLAEYPAFFRMMKGDHRGARQLLERVRPLAAAPDVTPLTLIFWCVLEASYEALVGNATACFAAVDAGLATAKRSGVLGLNHLLAIQGVYGALAAADLDVARRYAATAREHLRNDEKTNRAHLLHVEAWMALCAGDTRAAEEHARASMADAIEAGPDVSAWGELTLAHVHVDRGEHEQAMTCLERGLAWARRVGSPLVEHDCFLALAYACVAQGQVPEALCWLAQGLRLGRERGFIAAHRWMGWRRHVLAQLAALALEHDIEVEYVRDLIGARRLVAPDLAADAWPWPIRVRTLGTFELWRDGAKVSFQPKVPRKPLEVLQVLATRQEVREPILADALWPDADGDAARHTLQTAVYRLRRILGSAASVIQSGGTIRLEARVVWSDARALQRRLASALSALERAEPASSASIRAEVERVLELYRGPLLPGSDAEWARSARATLRAQMARFVGAAARSLEKLGEHTVAETLTLRALHADPDLPLAATALAG